MTTTDPAPAKQCPVCDRRMDPHRPWWWTGYGATCSEPCAQNLVHDHEGGIQR